MSEEPADGPAEAIKQVADELSPLHKIEFLSDGLAEVAGAISDLAVSKRLQVLAEHGSTEDREWALQKIRDYFEQ